MKRETWLALALGVPAGLVIGYFAGSAHLFDSDAAAPTAAPTPNPAAVAQVAAQQRILATEAALAQDPKNLQAWESLGNDYFDLHMAQKAVDAYAKALALAPDAPEAPNLLTDQGVMYRELKAFDRAIADFKQANKLNPQHTQSLFNLGIVYAKDVNKPKEALEVWNKVIALAPTSANADQARQSIAELQAAPK